MQISASPAWSGFESVTTDWTGGLSTGRSGGEDADEAGGSVECECRLDCDHAGLLSSDGVGITVVDFVSHAQQLFPPVPCSVDVSVRGFGYGFPAALTGPRLGPADSQPMCFLIPPQVGVFG